MLRIVLYALPLILAVYALVDLVQTDEKDVQGLPKLVWVLLIVLVWIVGPVAWLVAGRKGRELCRTGNLSSRGVGDKGRLMGLAHGDFAPCPGVNQLNRLTRTFIVWL